MAEKALPTLEFIVQRVVEQGLTQRDFPAQLSLETVRQFHAEVHTKYCRPGRKEMPPRGTIKKAVRTYLERQYDYIQEYMDNPLKPGGRMIVSAHYERKKEGE